MTCCSECSRGAKRRPYSVATHYVLHLNSVVELHAIDELREPFKPRCRRQLRSAHRPRACRSSRAFRRASDILSCARFGGAQWRSSTRSTGQDTVSGAGCSSPSTLVLRPISAITPFPQLPRTGGCWTPRPRRSLAGERTGRLTIRRSYPSSEQPLSAAGRHRFSRSRQR